MVCFMASLQKTIENLNNKCGFLWCRKTRDQTNEKTLWFVLKVSWKLMKNTGKVWFNCSVQQVQRNHSKTKYVSIVLMSVFTKTFKTTTFSTLLISGFTKPFETKQFPTIWNFQISVFEYYENSNIDSGFFEIRNVH